MAFQLVSAPPLSKIERCEVIGKVISSVARAIAILPLLLTARLAIRSWPKWPGKKRNPLLVLYLSSMHMLPAVLQQSLTWDRGTEMMGHRAFSAVTRMGVYLCDPQSPWQRGTNENTNGLFRQCFPKGSCLLNYSQHDSTKVTEFHG